MVARAFATRGVIEGFYGTPWPADARDRVLSFCAERGMNAYVYAPKDDALHRSQWRTPYPPDARAGFAALARHCRSLGMSFGFALSPGLDLDPVSDRDAVLAKLLAAVEDGADWVVLAFDDLPGAAGPAEGEAQAGLVAWTADALWQRAPDVRVSMVPTQYVGSAPSPYLAALAGGLPRAVDIAWTGSSVVCPAVTADEARDRANALDGRPPLLWDNYPVNDGGMARSLFLGPYTGREPGLADEVAGVLCNPMPQAHASLVALATAADFLADPAGYDPGASWEAAIHAVGGPDAGALRVLAEACADSPLAPARSLRLHRLLDRFEAGDAAGAASAAEVAAVLEEARRVQPSDPTAPLWIEVAPWLEQLRLDAKAGLRALALLDALDAGDAAEVAAASWALAFAWDRSRAGRPGVNVFGPRFAVYPMAEAGPDGNWAVDLARSVVEDQSAVDRLCRLAVARAGAPTSRPQPAPPGPERTEGV